MVRQRRAHEYVINRYYAHLIDPFFTKWAHDLALSPNQVTLLATIAGVSSGATIFLGYPIWGAVLLQLHHFLDGADGNLARLTGRCSPLGAKLDRIGDQLVRATVFSSVALTADVENWQRIAFLLTIYVDLAIVHIYVLPHMRKVELRRARWKQWFLDRGIIPGLDHFTLFFFISLGLLIGHLDWVLQFTLVVMNWNWLYRVYECLRSPSGQVAKQGAK